MYRHRETSRVAMISRRIDDLDEARPRRWRYGRRNAKLVSGGDQSLTMTPWDVMKYQQEAITRVCDLPPAGVYGDVSGICKGEKREIGDPGRTVYFIMRNSRMMEVCSSATQLHAETRQKVAMLREVRRMSTDATHQTLVD